MQDSPQPTSKYFNSNGLKLHYLDWGNPSAPLLILQHGMHDHARSWDWVARELCNDWHVIAPDLRGHGDSEWSTDGAYHTSYYLLDFAALIESLQVETFSIIAHSLGGNPTARYSGIYPERITKLVLVDALGPSVGALTRWNEEGVIKRNRDWLEKRQLMMSRKPRSYASIDDAVIRMKKSNKHLSDQQAWHLTEYGLQKKDEQYYWKYDSRTGAFSADDFAIHLSEYWQEITAPTLLCWGPESWNTNPDEDGNATFFSDAQTITFNNAGHWLHHDQLEDFVKEVKKILAL